MDQLNYEVLKKTCYNGYILEKAPEKVTVLPLGDTITVLHSLGTINVIISSLPSGSSDPRTFASEESWHIVLGLRVDKYSGEVRKPGAK